MTILHEELARLIALARDVRDGETQHPISAECAAAAWRIAQAVPWISPVLLDREGDWSRLTYPPGIDCDLSVDSDSEVNFDFDYGARPNRCMLALIARQTGALLYSLYTPKHRESGTIARVVATERLAQLFQQFTLTMTEDSPHG